jgi:hypothetical protein
MAKKFIFELIDIPYLSRPTIGAIDIPSTAARIQAIRKGGSRRNYDRVFKLVGDMTSGMAKAEALLRSLEDEPDEVWRRQLQDVCERLYAVFGKSASRWYPVGRRPIELYERSWFKPAIRGVWWRDGVAAAMLVNPRKTLFLDAVVRSFLARGVIEFHLVDDPNLHEFKIIDLGAAPRTGVRATRVYSMPDVDPMELGEFESILRRFMQAVEHAGFANQPSEGQRIADLFKRPKK